MLLGDGHFVVRALGEARRVRLYSNVRVVRRRLVDFEFQVHFIENHLFHVEAVGLEQAVLRVSVLSP